MRLLDTDILIDVQRGHPPALAWFSSLTEVPYLPGFVAMELLQDDGTPDKFVKYNCSWRR